MSEGLGEESAEKYQRRKTNILIEREGSVLGITYYFPMSTQ